MKLTLMDSGYAIPCPVCYGDDFRDFTRTTDSRARAICQNCGEALLFVGARLIEPSEGEGHDDR